MGIQINQLTKVFPNGKGIFDLSFEVKQGEVFGYLGPNGAGKSTTIRHLMGFMKPKAGFAKINGLDCWSNSAEIQKHVGYLPGEIAFLDNMNGLQFLDLLGGMRGMKDLTKREELIERFQFDVKTPIRKMSKGMKQKVGIVAAFMHDPEILILDEPTSGLDPLMQSLFIDLILEEKSKGKTILMSSHIFQEIDRTCDRVGIIKDGRLVAVENVQHLQSIQRKVFDITVQKKEDLEIVKQSGLEVLSENGLRVKVAVQGDYNHFVKVLAECEINNLDIHAQSLEEIFMHFYDREEKAI
ncbi:ABC transporter ATP-binding protein [Heyndrickxia shackletonii]|uniref:ABC transporter ATP-binding protein n=1 Tax=Heyndrickxia shackletonii TaxID=157838 RepID=A0A0Q3WUF4_9BACI|nr:ABC transporter ATP-binding protein [Heyndrickxia shackletonii]KQL52367.1 ABC transporter ATP-binding protein [Heyndrickxia shackletonii]MBB2479142.1 ABC transporter ATP-binding protein [Bacillus sp. APMAM]NEY99074.1 ABC transporter ATP-binding protein [Heyndrickxia shackletonii]RTZ57045.1 ABC transporter ATP-binding protein [Bacillus sp. SAJ1]